MKHSISILVILLLLGAEPVLSQINSTRSMVRVSGAMRNVMQKGELQGTIALDTISAPQVYGLGPLENLAGELLMLDGKVYTSTISSANQMQVRTGGRASAPFFVYARVPGWTERELPETVRNLQDLEHYLQNLSAKSGPFPFRLMGPIKKAKIHVVNLPGGTAVRSPADAHQGQQDHELHDVEAHVLGFFSTEHKGIFTHHDTFLHLHLLKVDETEMGHLDAAELGRNIKLFLPIGFKG